MENLKPLSVRVSFFALARETMFIEAHSIESRCYRSGKCTVCRRVRAAFSPEILQAGAVEGLNYDRNRTDVSKANPVPDTGLKTKQKNKKNRSFCSVLRLALVLLIAVTTERSACVTKNQGQVAVTQPLLIPAQTIPYIACPTGPVSDQRPIFGVPEIKQTSMHLTGGIRPLGPSSTNRSSGE